MSWQNLYRPANRQLWQGRTDTSQSEYLFQTIQLIDLQQALNTASNRPHFAFLGFACDAGVKRNQGRPGANEGPDVMRQFLAKLPLHRKTSCIDAGTICCQDDNLEAAQSALAEAVNKLIAANYTPILLGGGHEISWGHFQGIQKSNLHANLGIINFDAHFDMRDYQSTEATSSGTPFLQIAKQYQNPQDEFHYYCIGIQPSGNTKGLYETAKAYQVQSISAEQIHLEGYKTCQALLDLALSNNKQIYLTICMDVFSSAYAPGVSATQPLGLTPWQVIPNIRKVAASGKVINYDLAELSPPHDLEHRTAKLAAALVYEILHHHK